MKKLLLSDYDQTFYIDEEKIKFNCEAINHFRELGNLFSIVTGRNYESIKEEVEKYQIPYDYLSCVDGSSLYNSDNNLIRSYLLNEKECVKLKERLDRKCDIEVVLYKEKNENSLNNIIQCYYNLENYDKIELLHEIVKEEIRDCNLHSEVLDFGYCKLLIINSGLTSKKKAGLDIAEIEKVHQSNIYAIGDHCNDVPMIEAFNGFAMENGQDIAKRVSIGLYSSVAELTTDIMKGKVKQKVKKYGIR